MSTAGIVEALPGRNGGYRLARDPSEITFLDIINALEGDQTVFRCTEIRRNRPARFKRPTLVCGIAAAMYRAEDAWRSELAATTLADIRDQLGALRSPPT